MGKCPVYTIAINENGLLYYHGIFNVEMLGKFERQLSKKEFRKVKRKFKKAKLQKLDNEYGMNIMDAPMTTVKYFSNNFSKTIKIKSEIPEKIIKAESYLKKLIENEGDDYQWRVLEEPIIQKEMEDSALDGSGRKEMERPKIIVQLNAGVDSDSWIKKYQDYDLKVEKRISPNRPLFLLIFDNSSIDVSRLLEKLNRDQSVSAAEINKKIKLRDR
jgi:hypothetical protein